MVTSQGYPLVLTYTKILDEHPMRLTTEFINKTSGTIHIYVGKTPVDADAIPVPSGSSWYSQVPLANEVHIRAEAAGDVVVVTEQGGA